MARKKRQGNDIRLRWAIINKETSEPYDLTGRDIQLWMTSRLARFQVEDFDIRENVISWTFFGKDQSRTGIYNAVLIENCGVAGMHAVDIEAAVEIVEHTWQAESNNDGAATGIDVEGIDLESQIDLGIAISRQDIVSALGYLPVSPSDIPTSLKDLEDDAGHRTVTDDEKSAWSGKSDFSGKYVDLSGKPDLTQFVKKTVNDLANYYLKSETYTKEEVSQLLSAITTGFWQPVSSLPEASADTFGLKIYLVPSPEPKVQNQKDEFITTRTGSEGNYTYAWEQIGSTAIDLSGFVTTEALNAALANYVTSSAFQAAMAGKQDTISDLVTIRSGAAAGATAYQKPASGIPASDLADSESVFIIPINLNTQTVDPSVAYQDIVDAYNAGKMFAFSFGAVGGIIPATQYGALNGEYSIIAEYIMSVSSGGIDGASMILQATSSALTFTMTPQELEVPEISTDINADATSDVKTASPKAVKTFVERKGYGTYSKPSGGIPASDLAPDVVPVIPVDTAIPSGGLGANVHYALGTLTGSVSITLDTTTEVSGQMNIYSLVFTAGATAPTITWSSAITMWAGNCLDSNGAPVITAGNSYEVSIVNGLAVITEFVA